MVSVSSDDAQFSALLSLNTKMQALWLCAHVDQTSFPNILKDKRTDLKKSALKNQRGPAAAELMKELWHTDYAALLDSLKTSLLTLYPVGEGVDCTQPFNILFPFSTVPSAQPDLSVIGNAPTPRVSRSNKPRKGGKVQCVPVTAVTAPLVPSCIPDLKVTESTHSQVESTTKAVPKSVAQCVKDAEKVFLFPSAAKQEYLAELTLCVVKKSLRGKFESSVESLVSQLVQKEGEGFLIARVFFDFDDAQDDANEINYKKVYIQPGVVTLPFPIQKDQPNFLKCVWLPCVSADGDVSIPCENQYQFLYPDSPHIFFHNWDAFNPNPSHLFSKQQFDNGFTFFGSVNQFVRETNKVASAKPLTPQKRRATTALSPSTKRAALKTQLLSVVDEVVQDQEGLPTTVTFLDGQGNWPLCKSKKCKVDGRYAVYGEQAKKKASLLLQMQRLQYAAYTFQQLENLVEICEQA